MASASTFSIHLFEPHLYMKRMFKDFVNRFSWEHVISLSEFNKAEIYVYEMRAMVIMIIVGCDESK